MDCDDKLLTSTLTAISRLIYQWHTLLWGNIEVFQTIHGFFCNYDPSFFLPPLPAQAIIPSRTSSPDSSDLHSPAENKGVRIWAPPFHLRESLRSQSDLQISTWVSKTLQTTVHACAPYYLEGNSLPWKSFPPGFQLACLTERGFTANRASQSKLTNWSLFSSPLPELKQE